MSKLMLVCPKCKSANLIAIRGGKRIFCEDCWAEFELVEVPRE